MADSKFYLGKEISWDNLKMSDQDFLYKADHLTTHAVVFGMTGSGKTEEHVLVLKGVFVFDGGLLAGHETYSRLQDRRRAVSHVGPGGTPVAQYGLALFVQGHGPVTDGQPARRDAHPGVRVGGQEVSQP